MIHVANSNSIFVYHIVPLLFWNFWHTFHKQQIFEWSQYKLFIVYLFIFWDYKSTYVLNRILMSVYTLRSLHIINNKYLIVYGSFKRVNILIIMSICVDACYPNIYVSSVVPIIILANIIFIITHSSSTSFSLLLSSICWYKVCFSFEDGKCLIERWYVYRVFER